jgi:hypothetical protein
LFVHGRRIFNQVKRRTKIVDRQIVSAFISLHFDIIALWPPVKDKWNCNKISLLTQSFCGFQGEGIILEAGMTYRKMLCQ